ncbi:hypothetical protein SAMN05880582_102164 [Rhizobium sp. RU20A]|nr:hypothetical protein SAMN05880582_102164 [Rhizobium sp. RU20A]
MIVLTVTAALLAMLSAIAIGIHAGVARRPRRAGRLPF